MLSVCDLMCVVAEGNEFYGQKLACLELEMDGWMDALAALVLWFRCVCGVMFLQLINLSITQCICTNFIAALVPALHCLPATDTVHV